MKLDTIDDFLAAFPDEATCRQYLCEVRWKEMASCPYCDNKKAYFIENGKRFKCANPKCYKKFSVTVHSLMEASNLPYQKWLQAIYLYCKTRGRVTEMYICSVLDISFKAGFYMMDKLHFMWSKITRKEGETIESLLRQCTYAMFHLYYEHENIKKLPYYNNPFHISNINDISDNIQYQKLIRYTRYYITVWAQWMFMDFASAEDILAETFLYMRDKNIKEYNAEMVIKAINRIAGEMWLSFINSHPKYHQLYQHKNKREKNRQKVHLKKCYVVELILKSKGNKLTREQINRSAELIENKRVQLINKRKKSKKNAGFISHFE